MNAQVLSSSAVFRERLRELSAGMPNQPEHEIIFMLCDGQEPDWSKRLVMRCYEIDFITEQDAGIIISALGLEAV